VLLVCQVHKRILERTRHNQPVYGAGFRRGYELLISGNKKLIKYFIPDKKRGLHAGDLRHCGAPLTTGWTDSVRAPGHPNDALSPRLLTRPTRSRRASNRLGTDDRYTPLPE
jgi:hypothetical protein